MSFNTTELYLFNPVVSSDELRDTMNSFLQEWIKQHSCKENKILYHYTNLSGLKGIFEQRTIWLSHISQLNDPMEIQYGKNIIRDLINERIKDENNANIRSFYHTLTVQIGSLGEQIHHPFIFCFCENGDLLSQWREYSEKGGGFNLGFEFSEKTRIFLLADNFSNAKIPHLRKVIYNKEEQLKIVNDYLDKIIKCISSIVSKGEIPPGLSDMSHFASVMAMQAVNVLLDILMTFKNPAFEVESEWRLIYVISGSFQPERLNFRENLIPYHIFNLYDANDDNSFTFPIKSINYGPMHDTQKTRPSLSLYIQHIANNGSPINFNPELITIQGTSYQIRT